MKICIVGGTGNISSSIVDLLIKNKHEVVCFNRGLRGSLPKNVRLIKGDRSDFKNFEKKIQKENFDVALDMLCFNHLEAKSSIEAFKGVKHYIMCSTVVTYGNKNISTEVNENFPTQPYDSYGHYKAEAELIFKEEFEKKSFPVTIVKPSTVYGPNSGLLRQVGSTDFSWIDRIKKGKPLIIADDGSIRHQFLHADDAALAFEGILGKKHCIGQNYILASQEATNWKDYHNMAMEIIGKQVELVKIPFTNLSKLNIPNLDLLNNIFSKDISYSTKKIVKDVPEFKPKYLIKEGMKQVIDSMYRKNQVPDDSEKNYWEDQIINAHKNGKVLKKIKKGLSFKIKKILNKIKKSN